MGRGEGTERWAASLNPTSRPAGPRVVFRWRFSPILIVYNIVQISVRPPPNQPKSARHPTDWTYADI